MIHRRKSAGSEGIRGHGTLRQAWRTAIVPALVLIPAAALAVAQGTSNIMVRTLAAGATVARIQQALDSLPAAGGEVVLPAGKIVVDRPIVLGRDGLALRGAGDSTVLWLANNANCPVIIMGRPVDNPERVEHLQVSDLFIDGNRAHQQRENWRLMGQGVSIRNNGITVQNVSDSRVENVTCARCRSGGLVTTLGTTQLTVSNLESFGNEFDGLAGFETKSCHFTKLYLHDNPGAGISLDGNFNHNVIDNAILSRNDVGIFMRWSHDNVFRDVSIRNSRHYGVFMAENIEQAAAPGRDLNCFNNSFSRLTEHEWGDAAFRVNDPGCTNNVLLGARFIGDVHGSLSMAMPGLLMMK
ncbi:MAG: right-handed parallel beta-helix repeat-containing protein [Verrucomicrobia bacterium]|nr:right-handed parallel beta-helix repeat-containing protein [Verrucomicrobiota bacterium]